MKEAIITVGISASGKTTWAKQFQQEAAAEGKIFVIISRDDFRWALMKEKGLFPCWENWKWKWENQITESVEKCINEAATADLIHGIILADTNLKTDRRACLINKLENLGFDVNVKYFDVSYDEAVRRDAARENGVGSSVIQRQYQDFLRTTNTPLYVPDEDLDNAVIVDIDGTVAHMTGRGPFMQDKVHLDSPDKEVFAMVRGLHLSGYNIIFVSGRDNECYDLTYGWLKNHIEFPFELYMRGHKDQRKDYIIKREIFDSFIKNAYAVRLVIDDRPSVCRMWRDMGLKVVQCGNPYIEF